MGKYKLTDDQIVNVLELCVGSLEWCDMCPLKDMQDEIFSCIAEKQRLSIDLVKRQKAELEELNVRLSKARVAANSVNAICGLLRDDNLLENYKQFRDAKKSVKEFAKKLCDGRVPNDPVVIAVKTELKMMENEE